MAAHRKKSAKKRVRTSELAVAAFLGLAVTAAPAVAAADSSDSPSSGTTSDSSSADNSNESGSGAGGVNAGPRAGGTSGTTTSPVDDDDDDDEDSGLGGNNLGGGDVEGEDANHEDDPDLDDPDLDEGSLGADDGEDTAGEPTGEEPAGGGTDLSETDPGDGEVVDPSGAGTDGTGAETVEPPVLPEPVDPEAAAPEGGETAGSPTVTDPEAIVVPEPDDSDASLLVAGNDASPTPPALASALLDVEDIVPPPPSIPAFDPFMGAVKAIASWLDAVLPAYDSNPILNPTQVAAGFVMTLQAVMQGTYWNGQPTLFTFGAYILLSAAYQRYERLATNHLPGAPTLAAGPLPLTWKLTSTDPDGDPLIYTVSGQPSNGLITMLPDGSFTFLPTSLDDLNNGADVTFTVKINDSLGFLEHPLTPEGNDAEFTVTFRYPGLGVNNLPVFEDDGKAQVVGSDGSTGKVIIRAEASDSDGDTLTYTATALFGTVVRNEDGTFTYTPSDTARHLAATLLGAKTDIVSIWANDGRGGITLLPTTVTVDIVSSNGAPTVTVNPDTFTDPILGSITGSLDIDDPDGDIPIVTPNGLSTRGGLVTVLGNVYTYTPSLSIRAQGGTDTFTLSVNDLHGGTTEVTITVTVAQINVAPVFESTPTITHTDHTTGVLTGTFKVRDGNGDTLTFTSAAVLGTIAVNPTPAADGVTYTFTYTPYNPHAASLPLAITTDLVTITAWDGGLLSGDSATFTVQLSTQVNQTPSATYQNTGSNSILGTVSGKITVTDDDLLHGYTPLIITTGKGSVLVNGLTGDYTYTASIDARNAASASGASPADKIDTFTITVTDPAGKSVDVLVTVTIPQWNLPPAGGVASNIVADSNGVVRGQITGVINLDDDPLTYSITGSNGAGTAYTSEGGIAHVNADGSYVYIPRLGGALGYYDSFSITVSDGRGGSTNVLVGLGAVVAPTPSLDGVTVTKVNGAPGVTTGSVSLGSAANNGLFSSLNASGAGFGTVAFNGTNYTYTRTATGHVGGTSDTFDIYGTAFGLTIKIGTVTVTPIIPNAAPAPGTLQVTESGVTNVLGVIWQETKGNINAVDADGDELSYETTPLGRSTANGGLVYVNSDGSFTYRVGKFREYYHNAAATGATGNAVNDTFSVTVTDSFGAATTIVVSIPIEKLNATPSGSVSVGNKTTDALGVVRGTVSGSDSDDDSLTYSLIGGTNGTAATANGGIVRFSGNSFTYIPTAGNATDSFQVQVNDGHGGVSTATVTLTGLTTPSPTTNVNTSTVNVVTGQLNTAGNTGLTYSVGSQGSKGTVAVTSTGAFTYTRNSGLGHTQAPGDTFTIRATDTEGNSVIIATVNVTPVVSNAAPVAGSTVFNPSTIEDKRILGVGDWKQTTTGTLKATDSDGDTVTFTAGSFSTGNGGTVVINANGTFTYTIEKGYSYFHEAARIGASGSTIADTFSATAVDGFGGSTTYSVSVAVYAMNKAPTISGGTKGLLGNVTFVNVDDDDGDSLTFSHNGDSFSFGGRGLATSTLWGGNRLTVTDGYYTTVNGVVTGTPASVTKTW
ncbi:Ig-like domain-containing protein [Mycobacterium sp. AMU20-3851]|uniref:Ig-like domain-containing protein n=1 Tax=Mycobacterium sp. AMU20-3851 TaxID=3122055 RepID=UPI00375404B5